MPRALALGLASGHSDLDWDLAAAIIDGLSDEDLLMAGAVSASGRRSQLHGHLSLLRAAWMDDPEPPTQRKVAPDGGPLAEALEALAPLPALSIAGGSVSART